MRSAALSLTSLTAAVAVLSGCAADEATLAQSDATRAYQGIQTVLLDNDLVSFRVAMTGGTGNNNVEAYGRCAAAQYALIRGFGFARHVRTTVARDGTTWRGDAVYLISAALPPGLKTIDAEVTVRDCGEQGIPTI